MYKLAVRLFTGNGQNKDMKTAASMCALIAASFLIGCIKFGDDTELIAPNVTVAHLDQATGLTGIQFPAGSTGLGYIFWGSGIDDALALKVSVPADKKAEFQENEIFQKGSTDGVARQPGDPKWWRPDTLKDPVYRQLNLPNGRFVECTFGTESGAPVAYIFWFST